MPLSNIFLWVMLILVGLLSYQLLISHLRAERRISNARQNSGDNTQYAQNLMRTTEGYSQHVTSKSCHYFIKSSGPINAAKADFLTVGHLHDLESAKINEVNLFLPYAGSRQSFDKDEKMTVVSDCHHCA